MVNRKDIRSDIAIYLKGYTSGLAQEVFDHQPDDWDKAPFVMVLDSGTFRDRTTLKTTGASLFYEIHNIVPAVDPASGWTALNAEDALGDLEQAIASFVYDRVLGMPWQRMDYWDRSLIDKYIMDGRKFLDEVIPIKVEVY